MLEQMEVHRKALLDLYAEQLQLTDELAKISTTIRQLEDRIRTLAEIMITMQALLNYGITVNGIDR